MIAVITGDIINSRKMPDKMYWLERLKEILRQKPKISADEQSRAEIFRGDSFQWEWQKPEEVLKAALQIRAGLKALPLFHKNKMDVRLAIGIGAAGYTSSSVTESDGEAYHFSGHRLDETKKSGEKLAIKTIWQDFDEEMTVSFQLASAIMDDWTAASAETAWHLLTEEMVQSKLARKLNISQPAVNKRLSKSHLDAILHLEKHFRAKVKELHDHR